ncbi:putative sugar O-methyltransferase [Thalassospiraceae bacterium LMO-JJ14]|nr:putative sugar O-methyltransferase [Thalassospiraceae bacterium LMO-JJ14]
MSTEIAPYLLNEDAVRYLLAHADDDEASTSAYWKEHKPLFSVREDGTVDGYSVLGNVTEKRSLLRNLAHRILQIPLKGLARQYSDLGMCERLGRRVAHMRGQQFTYDTLRHVFTLALIRQHRKALTESGNSLVIGDGFGIMASLLLANSPDVRIFIVNLTKSLSLDMIYLKRTFPDIDMALVRNETEMSAAIDNPAVRVVAVQADNAALLQRVPIGLAVNIVSMQEMDLPVVAGYFDILRRNPAKTTAFYCCNRRYKNSNFEEYPWRDGDTILEDGICEWSQRYYTARPPFLHKRAYGKKVVLHRFVDLEKDHA